MHCKGLLAVAVFGLALQSMAEAVEHIPVRFDKGYAKVTVRLVNKRSAIADNTYSIRIDGLGEKIKLNLEKPAYSVFTPNFVYQEASTDSYNQLQLRDATPTKDELAKIERNFYTDSNSNAAISLRRIDGAFHLSGRVDDLSIVTRSENVHEISRKSRSDSTVNDYIDLKRVITPGPSSRASAATPEVYVIFDYDNTQTFKNNRNAILDYLGVFFHAINNRYATASDPQISFRISGVTLITSRSAQPYMENNKVPDGSGYDISKVLEDYSKWLYANSQTTPKYDMGALITGTDMQMKDSSGKYAKNVAGLAYLKGTCWNYTTGKQYLGSSVTEDIGGYYDGLFSVAHELAHNLASPHDGSGDASSCSWDDGYLMSYKGWGTKNKFYFSKCSLNLMKNFIDSSGGACTKTQQSSTNIPISSQNVGDKYTMQQLCVKYTKSAKATVAKGDPNDLCKNLKCQYPTPNKPEGWTSTITLNHPPGDNSPCGNGGRCINGDCVGSSG